MSTKIRKTELNKAEQRKPIGFKMDRKILLQGNRGLYCT